jgi:hypothetical protein
MSRLAHIKSHSQMLLRFKFYKRHFYQKWIQISQKLVIKLILTKLMVSKAIKTLK